MSFCGRCGRDREQYGTITGEKIASLCRACCDFIVESFERSRWTALVGHL